MKPILLNTGRFFYQFLSFCLYQIYSYQNQGWVNKGRVIDFSHWHGFNS
ncbi:hypothetical protein AO371_1480 [Moraxella catarrhalis]|nr:hypothetical protein AO378_0963 [Moraxella catarrhalis]OAV12167.1 hypothetical protein AO380_0509 [Moraxella catarrhalis]OAV23213.1 hypothetical protein AO371_1480 [Moraxella catarrhalis]OAV29930.1 hypothetical protein AO367_1555 [Moraxella catarrhalis]